MTYFLQTYRNGEWLTVSEHGTEQAALAARSAAGFGHRVLAVSTLWD